jgi:hypothetical protein
MNAVSFHEIRVSEYTYRLGDSPYAQGPPVSLGLEKVKDSTYTLQDYESQRARKPRRTGNNLRLNPYERSNMCVQLRCYICTKLIFRRCHRLTCSATP